MTPMNTNGIAATHENPYLIPRDGLFVIHAPQCKLDSRPLTMRELRLAEQMTKNAQGWASLGTEEISRNTKMLLALDLPEEP